MLAINSELPNHESIFAIVRVDVLNGRERCFRDVGVVSTEKITVVINDVNAVVEPPEFQLFLATSRQRAAVTPSLPIQTMFDELTESWPPLIIGLRRNR